MARIQALRLSSVFALVLVAGLAPRLARADEARASGPTGDAPKADGSSASARPTRPPLTASLAWARAEGAEECIAAPTLAKEIEARLKREVFVSPATAEVTVEGSVAPLAAPQRGYRASFRVLDRTGAVLGSRQVETHEASCRTLDERAILIASILIDDAEHVRAAEGPPAPVAPSTTPPISAPARPRVGEPPAPRPADARARGRGPEAEPSWGFGVDVGLGMTSGLQPGVGLGVTATFVVRPPRFGAFFLGAGLFPETRATTARGAEVAADAQYGTVGVCPFVVGAATDRLEGKVCVGVLLGALRAQGSGFDESYGDRVATVAALAQVRGALRLVGPLVLTAGFGSHVGLVRAEVTYRDASESKVAFATAPAGILADVGLGLRF